LRFLPDRLQSLDGGVGIGGLKDEEEPCRNWWHDVVER
jgi:hypothetical protein